MKKLIFALFSMLVIGVSCKKSDPDPVAPINQPYGNSNDGTNWVYEVKTQDQATGDTITTLDTSRVTSPDTTIGSKSYYRVIHNDGTHTYYNITGNDYYQFQHIVIPTVIDTSIEAIYLKDNASVGASWSQVLPVTIDIGVPVTVNVTFTSTIAAIGGTKTVEGITYNDVITVGTVLTAPGFTINSTIQNFYARNIGLIQGNYDIDITGVTGIHNQTLLKFADPH